MSGLARPHRPKGLPLVAFPAFACQYILAGLCPSIFLIMSGFLFGSDQDNLLVYFWFYLGGVSAILLTTIFGVRNGHLWGVYAFRWFSWVLILLLAADFACAALLATGSLGDALHRTRSTGQFFTILSFLCFIPAFVMVRNIRTVRWLDPHSRPDEWEPPIQRRARQ